jgi:hypothetical protein
MEQTSNKAFRSCAAKYQPVWASLIFGGSAVVVVAHWVFPSAPDWILGFGIVSVVSGLLVFAVGTVAARREWEAKGKVDSR